MSLSLYPPCCAECDGPGQVLVESVLDAKDAAIVRLDPPEVLCLACARELISSAGGEGYGLRITMVPVGAAAVEVGAREPRPAPQFGPADLLRLITEDD